MELREAMIRKIWATLEEMAFSAGDGSELSKMKDGAILINCGFTGGIEKEALYEELKSGRLRAAQDDPMDERFNELPLFNWFKSMATKVTIQVEKGKQEKNFSCFMSTVSFTNNLSIMIDCCIRTDYNIIRIFLMNRNTFIICEFLKSFFYF